MQNIYDCTFLELTNFLIDNSVPKFRAKQVWDWLYCKNVTDFTEMKNLDKKTLNILSEFFYLPNYKVIKFQDDNINTQKVLLELNDTERVETVLMKQKHGYSICVTTQIGCKIGCSFCASHLDGFTRNLSAGEIVGQIMFFQQKLAEQGNRVSHVVIMGIGEPMDNYENVIKFIDIINDEAGLKIGARHITLSTSGIVPKILELANYPKQINLAISLHAPTNEKRSKIMKINNVYNIEQVIDAVNIYIEKTNRRVSFEYIMLKDVNDSIADANQLVKLLRGINCHVNLIPFNHVEEYELSKSSLETTKKFCQVLEDEHIQVTIRRAMGEKIDGACGQLRRKR